LKVCREGALRNEARTSGIFLASHRVTGWIRRFITSRISVIDGAYSTDPKFPANCFFDSSIATQFSVRRTSIFVNNEASNAWSFLMSAATSCAMSRRLSEAESAKASWAIRASDMIPWQALVACKSNAPLRAMKWAFARACPQRFQVIQARVFLLSAVTR